MMKKLLLSIVTLSVLTLGTPAFAGTHGTPGQVSGRSVGAAALSLLIWPGLGQAVNDQSYSKNVTHALLGLTGVFRFWSCYDAFVDRQGGVWNNRI
ncbi:hypothetical protein DBY21_04710 [Candidatus Gastranaerophilales bacterium]|nr:MAG: hypothetical protein DBY21_04710 [Candidatus Gastranaerophilales bacterium]